MDEKSERQGVSHSNLLHPVHQRVHEQTPIVTNYVVQSLARDPLAEIRGGQLYRPRLEAIALSAAIKASPYRDPSP